MTARRPIVANALRSLAALAACALVGCAHAATGNCPPPGAAAALPVAPVSHELWYPDGIVATDPAHTISGIYPMDGPSETCCWMGAEARFLVRASPKVKKLIVTVFSLPTGKLTGLSVAAGVNGKPISSQSVPPGLHVLTFPLSAPSVTSGTIQVQLTANKSFVPKDEGINNDPRHLALVLRSVAVR